MWLPGRNTPFFHYALLLLLLFKPFVSGWHVATVYNAGLGYVVLTIRLGLLLAVGLLCALHGSTRLGHSSLGVKGYPLGLVPPQGYAVTIPILKNVVSLE